MKIVPSDLDSRFFSDKHKTLPREELKATTDDLWMLSLELLKGGVYLLLYHPDTSIVILYRLNIKEIFEEKSTIENEISKAFIRFFEDLKSNGINLGSYPEYLDDIKIFSFPRKYKKALQDLEKIKTKLYKSDSFSNLPSSYQISQLNYERFVTHINTKDKKGTLSPLRKFSAMLEGYQAKEESPKEISFEENAAALERPSYNYITNLSGDPKKKNMILLDGTVLLLKEPFIENMKTIETLIEKTEFIHTSLDGYKLNTAFELKGVNPFRPSKKIKNILKQAEPLIGYLPAPYSGQYKDLKIPDPIPDKAVFEFLITLDAGINLVTRRVAVSSDMSLKDFDKLLSYLYTWAGIPYHMSEFIFPLNNNPESLEASEIVTWTEKELPKTPSKVPPDSIYLSLFNPFPNAKIRSMDNLKLKDFFPKFRTGQYRYDFGDNWYHAIELVGIYNPNEYTNNLPYLIDSQGTAPPEDSGGPIIFKNLINEKNVESTLDDEQYHNIMEDWLERRYYVLRAPGTLAPLFYDEY